MMNVNVLEVEKYFIKEREKMLWGKTLLWHYFAKFKKCSLE